MSCLCHISYTLYIIIVHIAGNNLFISGTKMEKIAVLLNKFPLYFLIMLPIQLFADSYKHNCR